MGDLEDDFIRRPDLRDFGRDVLLGLFFGLRAEPHCNGPEGPARGGEAKSCLFERRLRLGVPVCLDALGRASVGVDLTRRHRVGKGQDGCRIVFAFDDVALALLNFSGFLGEALFLFRAPLCGSDMPRIDRRRR